MALGEDTRFRFVDLFSGIGGFHAALHGMGGRCVYAAEIDPAARALYAKAWLDPLPKGQRFPFVRDVKEAAPLLPVGVTDDHAGDLVDVPDHEVLAAGFPCQSFSKSGHQQGVLDATRGTLFYNVLRIVKAKRPQIVFLENVRNLVGPRHRDTTFRTIVSSLREFGYTISDGPTIISPHRIHPDQGGTPQVRDRVYILAIRSDLLDPAKISEFPGFEYGSWNPANWRIDETPLALYGGRPAIDTGADIPSRYALSEDESHWIATYETFLRAYMLANGLRDDDGIRRLPGFPLWFRHQGLLDSEYEAEVLAAQKSGYGWKEDFLAKNREFFGNNHRIVQKYLLGVFGEFPESRKKLEWQAGAANSIWDCLIQLRPSGIRVKSRTYAPALVAINQAPIYGPGRRHITPDEGARLQGFPAEVARLLSTQPDKDSYRQLGNAVHVGAVQFALTQFVDHYRAGLEDSIAKDPRLRSLVRSGVGTLASLGAEPTVLLEPEMALFSTEVA